MKLNLSVDEVLTTTRAVRKRLDTSRPVPRALLEECLDVAMQAPNGSNQNQWRWIIVDDPGKIGALAAEYQAAMEMMHGGAGPSPDYVAAAGHVPRHDKLLESGFQLPGKLKSMPAILIPLMPGRPEPEIFANQASMWGSILPAIWSFMLALRERGLGSVWTTIGLLREKEIADILGVPFEQYAQAGMFPVAYTVGTDFRKAWRKPVSEVLSYNSF
jgi:nitroreductase